MKNISILTLILLMGFSACVKDEDLKEPTNTGPSGSPIIINEIMSSIDPDWMELYNTSAEAVDVSDYAVSDPGAEFLLPAGTTIAGNDYLILWCDKGNGVQADGIHTNFKISSTSGELIRLLDNEGNLVDEIDVPPMAPGVAWARVSDGADVWDNLTPSLGAANSNENFPPALIADSIPQLNDNIRYEYTVNVSDASGVRDVKLFLSYNGDLQFVDMAPVGDGDYSYILPRFNEGDELEYYVVASDETGLKTNFPESAPDDPIVMTIENGYPYFIDVKLSTENPGEGEDVIVTAEAFDAGGMDAVSLYYLLNEQIADDKIKLDMTNIGGNFYEATIPGQVSNSVIKYYLRAEDLGGQKTYYPEEGADFDHDIATTWPSVTVAPPVILEALVINEIQGGGSPDFIELYNGTAADIDLGGYKLHDSDPLEAYTIPAGTIIPTGGFWVLDCDGDIVTLFKVSSGGEDITLLDPSDNVVDQLLKDNWPAGHEALVGRNPDGSEKWFILDTESKGSSNNN
jgi:hypothetical protein